MFSFAVEEVDTCRSGFVISESHRCLVGEALIDQWRFTGVYGVANSAGKHKTWSLLHSLHRWFSLPWLYAEDLNEIFWSHEKLGLGPRQECMMEF